MSASAHPSEHDLLERDLEQREHGRLLALVHLQHRSQQLRVVDHDVVAEKDRERLVAHVLARDRHRVPEPEGIALADVVDVGEVVHHAHLVELVELVGLLEVVLELEIAVEVVLDGVLAAAGDHEDVGEAGRHRLFDDVLDRRLVDDRQHLLGLALRHRQEPRAEPGGGDHRFRHGLLHCRHRGVAHVDDATRQPSEPSRPPGSRPSSSPRNRRFKLEA